MQDGANKVGFWKIMEGTETAPDVAADGYAKFVVVSLARPFT